MGQTPSRDKQISDLYSSYLQQQQDLILQQQLQINDLVLNNFMTQNNSLPQLMFQNNNNNNNNNNQSYISNSSQLPQLPQLPQLSKPKLDPYKILGIDKNYDKQTLKKAYLKAAYKYHLKIEVVQRMIFKKVSIAYTLLKKKLKEETK